MKRLYRLGLPPRVVTLRLVGDALVLWLLIRTGLFAAPAAVACREAGCAMEVLLASVSWSPRTSASVVAVTVALCFVQTFRMRELYLLRNLGLGRLAHLGLYLAVVVPLEATVLLGPPLLMAAAP
jgi:hypothetical protein